MKSFQLDVDFNFSASILQKIVYSGANERSFREAGAALEVLADLKISTQRVERITKRIGTERVSERNKATAAWEEKPLVEKTPEVHCCCTDVAMVQYDGGRMQVMDRSVSEEELAEKQTYWRETKVGALYWMKSDKHTADPAPVVPAKFLDPPAVLQMVTEIKAKKCAGASPLKETQSEENDSIEEKSEASKSKKRSRLKVTKRPGAPELESRICVLSSLCDTHSFGKMLAGSALSEGLFEAERKAFVADGSESNWGIWKRCFSDWTPILDFVHAMTYIFTAAMAGRNPEAGWEVYVRWLTWVWRGEVERVIAQLAARQCELGRPEKEEPLTSPRQIVAEALTYLQNQQSRMRYDEYRREGLPITSCYIESTVKQMNARMKGTEKFWSPRGGEALLQLRADYLSDNESMPEFWSRRQRQQTGRRPTKIKT